MQTSAVFDTKPLLRPRQVEDAKQEIKSAEEKLKSPHIEDKAEVSKQLRRMTKSFQEQAPRPPANGEEEGRMVSRSMELLNEIVPAMCSQEEMRKSPPGAVDKFMQGENSPSIKKKILEWKNIQLRLKPKENEAANLERYRPKDSTLNMDNAFIPGKMFFMPPNGAGLPTVFNEQQLAIIRAIDPDLADRLSTLSNVQRAEVKAIVIQERSAASILGSKGVAIREAKKAKRVMSPDHKEKMRLGREAAAAKKAA